jgi:hypothetical protein
MKTPLGVEILRSWSLTDPPKYRLTVVDLLADQTSKGRELGLIIDLSNHETLYASDIPPGLLYEHVHLVTP